MKIGVIPQFGEALLDGNLFEFNETYDPRDPYGSDRVGFKTLKKRVQSSGDEIVTIDQAKQEDLDVFLFVDTNFNRFEEILSLESRPRIAYIMREPPTFVADNGEQRFRNLESLFDLVFTWNDNLADRGSRFSKYCIPQFSNRRLSDRKFSERNLLVNITSRKYSNHPDELYTERERVIKYFDRNHPELFTLYGRGWNNPPTLREITVYKKPFPTTYHTYRGVVDDKIAAYQGFRFALCFENMTNIHGYITEKIFDCFRAGVIPVYWGASNVTDYIPENLFIDYRRFDGPEELYKHLSDITEPEFEAYLDRITSFLDNGLGDFSPKMYAETIYEGIKRMENMEPRTPDPETKEMICRRATAERIVNQRDTLSRRERIRMLGSTLLTRPRIATEHPRALYHTFF